MPIYSKYVSNEARETMVLRRSRRNTTILKDTTSSKPRSILCHGDEDVLSAKHLPGTTMETISYGRVNAVNITQQRRA